MKIESGNVEQGHLQVGQNDKADRAAAKGEGPDASRTSPESDSVALSASLRQIRELAAEIKDVGAVDRARVDQLRAQVAAGTFNPSPDAIASALFGELVADAAV